MTSRITKGLAAGLALATALALGACGKSADSGSSGSSASATASASASASATTIPDVDRSGTANFPDVTGNFGETPTISAGTGDAPTQVSVKTLSQGSGAEVGESDSVLANYSGSLWDGTSFDSSFSTGTPAGFSLDSVITGWKYGLAGQHVGDRIEVVIPPEWGYGDSGSGTTIPGGSTLVFVVDILDTMDSSDTSALSGAQATGNALPDGVTITGDTGSEPTLGLTGTTQPTEDSETVIATGAGATIGEGDSVVYRAVAGYYGDESSIQSNWSAGPQVASAGLDKFVGQTVGSRLLFVFAPTSNSSGSSASSTASQGTVMVIDIIGVLSADASATK